MNTDCEVDFEEGLQGASAPTSAALALGPAGAVQGTALKDLFSYYFISLPTDVTSVNVTLTLAQPVAGPWPRAPCCC